MRITEFPDPPRFPFLSRLTCRRPEGLDSLDPQLSFFDLRRTSERPRISRTNIPQQPVRRTDRLLEFGGLTSCVRRLL
jgi:hypothetical protein